MRGPLDLHDALLHIFNMDLAIQAHRANLPIAAEGTSERVGRRWWLSSPTNLRLVQEDEPDEENSEQSNETA
jgi:hypothetical protein